MNLEDEMYRVMAALSAGDVPVGFKGAIPVSTAENNFGEKTFFVSTFLDKYKLQKQNSRKT